MGLIKFSASGLSGKICYNYLVSRGAMYKIDSPSTQQQPVVITDRDLPLCCPSPEATLWSEHPRVYLPITSEQPVCCPYCGTCYRLE